MSRSERDKSGGHRCGHGYHSAPTCGSAKKTFRRRWLKRLRRQEPDADRARGSAKWEAG